MLGGVDSRKVSAYDDLKYTLLGTGHSGGEIKTREKQKNWDTNDENMKVLRLKVILNYNKPCGFKRSTKLLTVGN